MVFGVNTRQNTIKSKHYWQLRRLVEQRLCLLIFKLGKFFFFIGIGRQFALKITTAVANGYGVKSVDTEVIGYILLIDIKRSDDPKTRGVLVDKRQEQYG